MRETHRLKTILAVVDRILRGGDAAKRLGISRRQAGRIVRRYAADGASGLVSRKRGRRSNHQLAPGTAERAITLIRERYPDFSPTHKRFISASLRDIDADRSPHWFTRMIYRAAG